MANETEIAIYCRIGNFEGLKQAEHIEDQMQLDSEYFNGHRCRVRRTKTAEGVSYVFTQKTPVESEVAGVRSANEDDVVVDAKFFDNFMKHCKKIVKKTRCVFPVKEVTLLFDGEHVPMVIPAECKYEVDAFFTNRKQFSEWCKVDFELNPVIDYLKEHHPEISLDKLMRFKLELSTLPFQPTQFIDGRTTDPKEKQFLSDLWDNDFNFWEYKPNGAG